MRADVTAEPIRLSIESLDLEANGVARHDGKVVFVRGALPGEEVIARVVRRKPRFDVAEIVELLHESASRVAPACPHFGVCGGCSMQHVELRTQLAVKQRVLEDQLLHIGRLRPRTALRAIAGPAWGYRQRARLSVRDVPKKGGVLVGFHERGSSYVADMRECLVLPPRVSALLMPLRSLVESLSIRDRMPQIEVAVGDEALALVFRVLAPLTDDDRRRLTGFARDHRLELWLQPKGPDSIELLDDGRPWAASAPSSRLAYGLREFDVRISFRPTDFTQVNHAVNEIMVSRALRLLAPEPWDRVADLFCGLGNFTLPLARRSGRVVGIEGSASLIGRARENARANGLAERIRFQVANLFEIEPAGWRQLGPFDRVLIDPPREGALAVVKAIAADEDAPRRIVYVSCNPATLARDASILSHENRYQLTAAGALNMFPHTSHVESIAVFDRLPETAGA